MPWVAARVQSDKNTVAEYGKRQPSSATCSASKSLRCVGRRRNRFRGDKYKWSLQLTAINIANQYGLYNFLLTFSGTHYVTPRALTAQLGFHF